MYGRNLGLKFEAVAKQYSNNVALRFGLDNFISYGELNRRANQIARLFLEEGAHKNDVICISGIKSVNTFAGILACLKIGVIYTIIDRLSPIERLRKIINNCLPKILYIDEGLKGKLSKLDVQGKAISLTSKEFEGSILRQNSNLSQTQKVAGSDPAYIMYTSGSTGLPKGAVMTHANVLNFISWSMDEFSFTSEDILINVNPLFFDNSVFDLYSSLFSGASLVPFDREKLKDLKSVVEVIDKLKCTTWFSVPSLLIYMNSLNLFCRGNMKYIKRIIFGGEGYLKAKLKSIYELYSDRTEFINVYGPTECTCICSAYRVGKEDFTDLIGIPSLGSITNKFDYLILDEHNKKVNPDEVGELCLLGPNVGRGYYNDPERTRQSFVQNPFSTKDNEIMYKTGDLVRYNGEDGKLYFASRKDYQIKHMGYRIELGEIEYALNTLDYVSEAVALYGDFKGFKQIIVAVKLCNDAEEVIIKNDLKKILPDYMIPRKIFGVKEIAKNPNGKIDRKKMAEIYFK